jgi:transposase-like protein
MTRAAETCNEQEASGPGNIWHLDEVFIRINGEQHYLWRAVDQALSRCRENGRHGHPR